MEESDNVLMMLEFFVQFGVGGKHGFDLGTLLTGVVVLGDLHHFAGKQDDGDQVGDGHESVAGVGNVPDQIAFNDGGGNDQNHVDNFESQNAYLGGFFTEGSENEFGGLFTIIGPGQNGGEGEERQDNREADSAENAEIAGEGGQRQGGVGRGSGEGFDGTRLDVGGEEEKGGQGTNDEGVEEDFENAPETLLYRFPGFGSGMSHHRGTKTCFVGEDTPGHTLFDDLGKKITAEAAGHGLEAEDVAEDHGESGRNGRGIHDDGNEGKEDEKKRHEGNQHTGHLADALDTADDDQGGDDGDNDTDDQLDHGGVRTEGGGKGTGNLVGLDAAHAQGGQQTENGGDDSQPFPLETVGDVVEGTTGEVAVLVLFAIEKAQDVFGIVGDHTEKGGNPHPEYRTGTTGQNGGDHADDVACADGTGDRGGEGFKLGNRLGLGILRMGLADRFEGGDDGGVHGFAKLANLHGFGAYRHQNAGAKDQNDHRPAPNDVVEVGVDVGDDLEEGFEHGCSSFLK